jgi:anti-sigma factor RsiW
MNCDCTEKISSLIDGELPDKEARELERHLLTCSECQDAKSDFLNLRTQIADFPVSFKPVAQREALAAILGPQKSPGRTVWRWAFNPAVAALASLLIIGAVVALVVRQRLKSEQVPNQIASVNSNRNRQPTPGSGGTGEVSAPKATNPKKSPTPAPDKNKAVPNKKRTPLAFEPQPDNIASNRSESVGDTERVRSADAETMTAIHFQKSELLLRSFRNVRLGKPGSSPELEYEKKLAQKLIYQNMMLRREADASGDAQVASLLESLEPILLDIANLPANARPGDVKTIKDRVERKNIVALLQVNSTALARALD